MTGRLLVVVIALLPVLLMYANRGTVAALVVVGLAGAWDLARRRWVNPIGRSTLALLAAFLAWGALSATWEETSGLALPKALQLLGLAVAGLLALGGVLTTGPVWRDRGLVAGRAGLYAAALLITVEWATGMAPSMAVRGYLAGAPLPPFSILITAFKSAASIMAVWAVLLSAIDLRRRRWGWAALSAIAGLAAVYLTGSLGGMLGIAAAVIVGVLASLAPRLGAVVVAAGFAALLAFAPAAALFPDTRDLARDYGFLPNSAVHRSAIWRFTAEKSLERPVIGWGLDASRELPGGKAKKVIWLRLPDRMDPQEQQILPLHPHNFAVQIWLEIGGLGALIVLALMLDVIRRAAKGKDAVARLATLSAAIALATVAFGIWQSWWVATLWLTLTLASLLSEPSKDRSRA